MDIINIGEESFVAGLHWSRLSGEKVVAEVATLSEEMEMPFGVIRKMVVGGEVIHQVGLGTEKKFKGLISIAAILADLEENALLIEEIGNDKYWICAVAEKEVVAGGDIICSGDEISDYISDIFSNLRDGLDGFVVYISAELAESTGMNADEHMGIKDILNKYSISSAKKPYSKYRIKSVKSSNKALILFGVFVIFAVGTGYSLVGGEDEGYKVADESFDMVLARRGPSVDEILKVAYEEEVNWLKEELQEQNPANLINELAVFMQKLPLNIAGWESDAAIFSSKNPSLISVKWDRGSYGTPIDFEKQAVKNNGISIDLNANNAITYHGVISKPKVDVPDNLEDAITNQSYSNKHFVHDLLLTDFEWKLDSLPKESRREEIRGIEDKEISNSKQFHYKTIGFDISGTGINDLYGLSNIIRKKSFSKITDIKISTKGIIAWEIKGIIYEK